MTPTIEQQTGWKRPSPKTRCQKPAILLKITTYSYNLDDRQFLLFFEKRTGIQLNKKDPQVSKWLFTKWLLTDSNVEGWLRTSNEHVYSDGRRVPLGKQRELAVRNNRIMRGRLQDCWELYKKLAAYKN